MKKIILTMAVLSGLTASTYAQTLILVAGDNFDADPLGSYGVVAWDFGPPAGFAPQINISNDNPQGTNTQNLAMTFNCVAGQTLNFGLETAQLTATGNTNVNLSAYILEFDLAIPSNSVSIPAIGGYQPGPQVFLFGNGADIYWPPGGGTAHTNPPASWMPAAGTGYQHYSIPLNTMTAFNGPLLTTTDATFAFGLGWYMGGITNNSTDTSTNGVEEIDVANLALYMISNAPPPPLPVVTVLPAKPGLRIFAESPGALTDQEGIGTVDVNQSWVGATQHPVNYSVTFQDFDVVAGSSFYYEMCGGYGGGVNPYIVYFNPNELQLTITQNSPVTWALDYKTNAGTSGSGVNVHVTNGTTATVVGTWTLSFISDVAGTVTPPGGPAVPFSLGSPDVTNWFANPMTICFGETAASAAGQGQHFDIAQITTANVASPGTNINDDFTTDASFNTNVWNPSFSVSGTNAVVLATTSTPLWVNWTVPALNYGLETKAHLSDTNWYQPTYWNGTPLLIPPTIMGNKLYWTLVPNTCLPTADGGTNEGVAGNASSAFFQLQNPVTAQ